MNEVHLCENNTVCTVLYFEIKLHQTENQKKFAEKKVKFCFLAWMNIFVCFELGTRQYCLDNVTKFSGLTVVGHCITTIFVLAAPSWHRDLNIFLIFSCPLSRCRCHKAKHLSRAQLCILASRQQFYLK